MFSGVGRTVRDAALYGAITIGMGTLLENMHNPLGPDTTEPGDPPHPDKPPGADGPFTYALDGLMHGAEDVLSLPGQLIGGISDAYETSKFITYLITAGVLVGGGVYLYRMRTD
jgi:hypothetical protein